MITSALIVLDDESARLRVFGLVWIDYVVRMVARSGITHVVVVVDRVPVALGDILDRSRRRGLSCSLARSTGELADLLHPDETVLLVGGTRLFDARLLATLQQAQAELLLCARDEAGPSFERIDAATWWTGVAVVTGTRVRAASAAPEGWNIASLLMRAAVQAGVERHVVTTPVVTEPDDPAAVAAFEVASLRSQPSPIQGWGSIVVEPTARLLARVSARRAATMATVAVALAAALAIVAVVVAAVSLDRRVAIVAGCIVLAKVAAAVARIGSAAIATSSLAGAIVRGTVDGAAAISLVASALFDRSDSALAPLALIVVGSTWLCGRGIAALPPPPRWWSDVAGQALLIGTACAAAPDLFAAAMVVSAIHAALCLVWWQDRVSELLSLRG